MASNACRAAADTAPTPWAVRRPSSIAAITFPIWSCVWRTRARTSSADRPLCSASLRTSSATTRNPRPCWPARAASIAAVSAEAEQLEAGGEGTEERRLAGRVMARRDMGKLTFLDLVDRSGRIQLLCPVERTGEVDVHLGDVVGAIGRAARSRRGEPSLAVDRLELLARIRTPLPDTFHGLTDIELRYRKRYLDLLMNEESRADFQLRTRMVTAIRRALDEEGFIEVETPILQPRY